jgi:hypothetical protein
MLCLASYKEKKRQMLNTTLLVLDELLSGWRPKISKFGGFPNIPYEPRKPVILGVKFKNRVEDFKMLFRILRLRNKFIFTSDADGTTQVVEKISLMAEVLWQVNGAGVTFFGWTGGDA